MQVAHQAVKQSSLKPVVLIAKNQKQAELLYRDVRFLLGEQAGLAWLLTPEERTPYQATSPDPVWHMEQLAILQKLVADEPFKVLIMAPQMLAVKILPPEVLLDELEFLSHGGTIPRDELVKQLLHAGYTQVTSVEDPGTFSVRGSIVDFYWTGNAHPVRVDLFGDEIERLYFFDAGTQKKIENLDESRFGLVRDILLTDANVARATQALRDLADELEYPTPKLREKLADLSNRIAFFGVEGFLPAFYERLGSIFELLGGAQWLFEDFEGVWDAAMLQQLDYEAHYKTALVRGELAFEPAGFLWRRSEIEGLVPTGAGSPLPILVSQNLSLPEGEGKILALVKRVHELHRDGVSVLLPVGGLAGVHLYKELLESHGVQVRHLTSTFSFFAAFQFNTSIHAYTFVAKPEPPAQSSVFSDLGYAVFSEDDVFGVKAKRQVGKKGGFKTTLADLEVGDPIVHVDHGIGLFKGLTRLNVRGIEQDYLLLTYAGEDKLYLPVHRINLIQPYSGAEGQNPRLDKLGGQGWQTRKKKVQEAVLAMAQDLLNLYAKRELVKRPLFKAPESHYAEFEAEFPFETTPDQQKAIDDVLSDMQKDKPMDRLICGDVGYGKTEVAMRAAMLAVLSGKQVAVLAPTTILAQQHGITFRERFKSSGARVEVVSRFQKASQIKDILAEARDGKVDILIGTHRILSSDVGFKNLGLVIVDEEQRFGIKDKEHLKKLRTHTDILTLSATPIPRTLQMGFFGIRDLSVIETPPVDRRAIRTSLVRFEDEMIRENILRELQRGGQVYFVHNRVSSIYARADYLRLLIPEARIEVGHGQMNEHDLEDTMIRFMKHEFHVLVCTTIIETGIDVPTANTMFIDHADDFGLAQLYQLRGRIGRSKERAFAYLVIPGSEETLTPIARKRLEILQRFSELGAGFRIAQHDLELRGAGDLLGKSQHGHVAAVGYDLYSDLLKEAVEQLKGQAPQEAPDPDIQVPQAALIPENYISDLGERMGYYQRLASAETEGALYEVIDDLQAQFGGVPEEVHALVQVMILKKMLQKLFLLGLEVTKTHLVFSLGDRARLDPLKLAEFVKAQAAAWSLTPKMKLLFAHDGKESWFELAKRALGLIATHGV
ncbi:MAG: transcription-repair coupling factor [Myxococcota bacterium]